ncbi:MAG: hypothetical protein HKN78_02950 [Sphingomonadaceae bacterium]|nr:hypothetical protein [Sphingomonadaceae bacterium]
MSMTVTRKFRSVAWAATVASAALGCYLISYRVSAERNALEDVEQEIAQARDDILSLNTEFQTRSRMSQLERWNRNELALTAPGAGQYVEGTAELASLLGRDMPESVPDIRRASAEIDDENENAIDEDVFEAPDPDGLDVPRVQQASYTVPDRQTVRRRAERIALLDDQLIGDIASQAAEEDSEDR